MDQVRQQLLQAKKDIEGKSGQSFSASSVALADLISAFVVIKMGSERPKTPDPAPLTQVVSKPSDDFLYGA